jgi:acetyl-CoA synthetase (ADP-forming)
VKALATHVRFQRERFTPAAVAASHSPAAAGTASLPPADSMAFLAEAGIPVTPFAAAASEEDAVAAAQGIGFPVALKLNSPDVTHKTDVGGVILGVADEAGVRAAFRKFREIERSGGHRAGGAIVCAMAPAGREVIIGVTRDAQFGHAILFGLGGTLVEVLKDVSFRIVPLNEGDAAEMISEVRSAPLLHGVRGQKPADLAALKNLLLGVSRLVENNPDVEEMDLNPVFVYETGVLVADARVVFAAGAERSQTLASAAAMLKRA